MIEVRTRLAAYESTELEPNDVQRLKVLHGESLYQIRQLQKAEITVREEVLSPMQNSFGRSLASDTKLVEDSDGNWKCQNCQEIWDFETNVPQEHRFYYCPNCGAKICKYIAFKEE